MSFERASFVCFFSVLDDSPPESHEEEIGSPVGAHLNGNANSNNTNDNGSLNNQDDESSPKSVKATGRGVEELYDIPVGEYA